MLTEKEMEDAIAQDPERYIAESGLRLISRQYRIGSYIFDLLFEDRHSGQLIVELQRGTLDREHTYKILDYYHEYKNRHPREFVELMVVANQIPVERKQRLTDAGIAFREIPASAFLDDSQPDEPRTSNPVPVVSPAGDPKHMKADEEFWRGLIEKRDARTRFFQGRTSHAHNSLGRAKDGVSIHFVVLKDKSWVELCKQEGSAEECEAVMQDFERSRTEIEAAFGERLQWERPTGRKRRKIMSQAIPLGTDNQEQWDLLQTKLVDQMERFVKALSGRGPLSQNLWSSD